MHLILCNALFLLKSEIQDTHTLQNVFEQVLQNYYSMDAYVYNTNTGSGKVQMVFSKKNRYCRINKVQSVQIWHWELGLCWSLFP